MTASVSYEQSCINDIKAVRERIWGNTLKSKNILPIVRHEQQQEAKALAQESETDAFYKNVDTQKTVQYFSTTGTLSAELVEEYSPPIILAPFIIPKPTMEKIAARVLSWHPGVTLVEVRSSSRKKNIMLARREIIATIKHTRPDLSYPLIGRFVNKDHTSCLHAVKRYEGRK